MNTLKLLNKILLRKVNFKIIFIFVLMLTGCGKQSEISTEVKNKFNPSSLFSCILWAVILMHTDRIVLLGIWLGMCTGAGGIRF